MLKMKFLIFCFVPILSISYANYTWGPILNDIRVTAEARKVLNYNLDTMENIIEEYINAIHIYIKQYFIAFRKDLGIDEDK